MAHCLTWSSCLLVILFRVSQVQANNCIQAVERGSSATLECPLPDTATTVTWQLVSEVEEPVTLSECPLSSTKCMDNRPNSFRAKVLSSNRGKTATLLISSPKITETKFACVIDNGQRIDPCSLEVYVWPTKPTCSKTVSANYVDFTCVTDNVYPRTNAVLHRKEEALTNADFQEGFPNCTLGYGSEGDHSETCTWRIPMENLFDHNTIHVEVTPKVTNLSSVSNKSPETSDPVFTKFSVPYVTLDEDTCPLGPGVEGDTIKRGTKATCLCEVFYEGLPKASARWVDKNNNPVVNVIVKDATTVLDVSYNPSDPNQKYSCWPVTPLKVKLAPLSYIPKFSSAAPRSVNMELQSLIIVLGFVFYYISAYISHDVKLS